MEEKCAIADTRPLSPHLGIYKPQITSVLSVFHRLTGLTLYGIAASWCGGVISLAVYPSVFKWVQAWAGTRFGRALQCAVIFCCVYHLLNGLRHLFWNMGWGYSLRAVYLSGIGVVLGALLLTTVLAIQVLS